MSIKKAESAGFCFGVNRAINIVNDLIVNDVKVCTLGPIIHNMELVRELKDKYSYELSSTLFGGRLPE